MTMHLCNPECLVDQAPPHSLHSRRQRKGMDVYTCISCRVTFKDAELQRLHYKSDWHRYNLKRKVAELPPITVDDFEQKLAAQKLARSKDAETHNLFCQHCNKGFSSPNAYDNHLQSKKHRNQLEKSGQERIADGNGKTQSLPEAQSTKESLGVQKTMDAKNSTQSFEVDYFTSSDEDDWEDEDVEEVIGDAEESPEEEDESLPPNFCLFCPHRSIDVEENLRHMTRSHSFFIPDIDYLTDVTGLLTYLGVKVGHGKVCLYCNERSRNFPTLNSVRMHMVAKGHCKIAYEGDTALEYSDFYDFSSTYPEEENAEQETEGELMARMDALEIDDETLELVLPSGARAGHRAFKTYYRQNIPPEHAVVSKSTTARIGNEYKALGWHGTLAVDIKKKMVVLRKVRQQRQKRDLQLQVKANKMQPHLRPQVIF